MNDVILKEGVVEVVVAVCEEDVEFLVQSLVQDRDQCQQIWERISYLVED